ncbi:XRE family transcriptional regulator [Phreatobacter sp. AB_2022a]|uniref:XRE family transcriptional regulator n=1 Tax=Phreatobacter sp. AB_2022a TaxID=3003134 RepID=UPI002286DA05|nr:XRE family transcriptional regulator [Phreatobacter sp. AB_2022a]MCZ0738658.1 XRE family transcriptional regulator [Phreatobacter sp. AB_2022a]
MTGHRSFNELRQGMSAERRARNADATQTMLQEMALHELRQAREKSQVELARDLHVGQPAVAKMEQRADMYVSNLRRYVEALGGKLEITARFPDASVTIKNFGELSAGEKAGQGGPASPLATS